MLAQNKGDDLTEAIKGPVSQLGLAILIIGGAFAYADYMLEERTGNNPNLVGVGNGTKQQLFGNFIVDMANEMLFYLGIIVPIVIIAGGVMVGLTLCQQKETGREEEREERKR